MHTDEVARHLANHTAVKLTVAIFVADQEVDIIVASNDELIRNANHGRVCGLAQRLLTL